MTSVGPADRTSPNLWLVAPAIVLTAVGLVLLVVAGVRAETGDGYLGTCRKGAWLATDAFVTDSPGSNTGVIYQTDSGWLARSLTDDRATEICSEAADNRRFATWVVGLSGALGLVAVLPPWGRRSGIAFALLLSGLAVYLFLGAAFEGPTVSLGLAGLGIALFAAEMWRRWIQRRRSRALGSTAET